MDPISQDNLLTTKMDLFLPDVILQPNNFSFGILKPCRKLKKLTGPLAILMMLSMYTQQPSTRDSQACSEQVRPVPVARSESSNKFPTNLTNTNKLWAYQVWPKVALASIFQAKPITSPLRHLTTASTYTNTTKPNDCDCDSWVIVTINLGIGTWLPSEKRSGRMLRRLTGPNRLSKYFCVRSSAVWTVSTSAPSSGFSKPLIYFLCKRTKMNFSALLCRSSTALLYLICDFDVYFFVTVRIRCVFQKVPL